jgi:menaquinone-dependent protoporphyrinogen oxidase
MAGSFAMMSHAVQVPVFYTTTEGQTRRIAERLAERLRASGVDSRALDMATEEARVVDWSSVRGALVGASLHVQQHQPAAAEFIRAHVGHLNAVPSAFFSVSLSAASDNPEEVAAAKRLAAAFPPSLGWHPPLVVALAGRLAYTQYNLFVRFMMKRIAKRQGGPTDTSRDYEFTNWDKVDWLAGQLASRMERPAA